VSRKCRGSVEEVSRKCLGSARPIACRSCCGFQSLSKRMHVSAVCRLMPRPPARVVMRKRKTLEPGALKDCRLTIRCTRFVEPTC